MKRFRVGGDAELFFDLLVRAERELADATYEATLAESRRWAAAMRHALLESFMSGLEGAEGSG